MNKKIILILYFIGYASVCLAFDFEPNLWTDFEGKLNKMEIRLSLYRFDNGQIRGNYCYKKYEEKIQLVGKIIGNSIELKEVVGGKYKGNFKGKISTNGPDIFKGIWTYGSTILNFELSLSSICGGEYKHRYHFFNGSDSDVENFMKKVKLSILNNEKQWLANHVSFPLAVTINKKNISLKNKKQFITNFDSIFYPKFKDKIKSFCVCNLFINSDGVMLGDGVIWINPGEFSENDLPDCQITAINN